MVDKRATNSSLCHDRPWGRDRTHVTMFREYAGVPCRNYGTQHPTFLLYLTVIMKNHSYVSFASRDGIELN
jgi:hypothetical protein